MVISLEIRVSGLLLFHVCNPRPGKHPSTGQQVSTLSNKGWGWLVGSLAVIIVLLWYRASKENEKGKYEEHGRCYVDFCCVLVRDDDLWLTMTVWWSTFAGWTSLVGNILGIGLPSAFRAWRCLSWRPLRKLPAGGGRWRCERERSQGRREYKE